MKQLPLPKITAKSVYRTCLSGVNQRELRDRLTRFEVNYLASADYYSIKAQDGLLYTIDHAPWHLWQPSPPLASDDLKNLYTYYLLHKDKPGRSIYDTLKSQTEKCPSCGFAQVETLDHYLPKSKLPIFSVTPQNLLPACGTCNKTKSSNTATSYKKQVLHPYFDRKDFFERQWLFARPTCFQPTTFEYYVSTPRDWPESWTARVKTHFTDYKLAHRYAVEAAEGFTVLLNQFRSMKKTGMLEASKIRHFLAVQASNQISLHPNHWRSAMLYAVANNEGLISRLIDS